ncbi:hypothetical protein E4L96_05455 [Massilia arenosa]|uniref:DUF2059 domain-containing protein n=1 Tax=Zemynaea arenosa TaxID=2561931 RepID=A0A4Y9SPB2_9BURK|nr:hypothetical protein [Massilia arenosa]TFW25523.1 hypothetical protein E4L96_05455 [Massilia arenosa]
MRVMILMVVWVLAAAPAWAGSQEACIGMVHGAKLGASFGEMLFQTGTQTKTYSMLANRVGNERAESMFRAEMPAVVARYQAEWNGNLARAWGQLLSDAECRSLAELGGKSPYRQRFETYTPAAAEAMRTTSGPLLQRAVSDALYSAFVKAMAPPPVR